MSRVGEAAAVHAASCVPSHTALYRRQAVRAQKADERGQRHAGDGRFAKERRSGVNVARRNEAAALLRQLHTRPAVRVLSITATA